MGEFNAGRKSRYEKRDFGRNAGRSSDRRSSGSDRGRSDRSSSSRDRSDRDRPDRNRSGGDFDRRSGRNSMLEMHSVICSKCGVKCEVPFKPTNTKPVYCRDCFRKNDGSESTGRFGSRNGSESRDRFEPRERSSQSSDELSQINMKLDKIMRALKID
jgi:CxxC-x17-CxxC domain-containing protein